MDKFIVRTKRSPRPERKETAAEVKKKQSTIESLPSVVVVEEILNLKCQLENEVSTPEEILSALKTLGTKNLSKDVLLSTKIGHSVNQLRRHESNKEIRKQAKIVFKRWRSFVRDLERKKPLIDVHCGKKSEAFREKARRLLADALQLMVSSKLPELIERTVFFQFNRLISNDYKRKIRSLVFTFKHKESIRRQLTSGEVTVEKLLSSANQLL